MSEEGNPAGGAPARRAEGEYAISPAQAARFVLSLRDGATVAQAAAAAGAAWSTLYYRRKRDPDFASCWREAAALARADEAETLRMQRDRASGGRGTIVRGHAGRGLVRKRKLPVEFDRDRKQIFLDHFAATCSLEASAAEAGISPSSVYRALQSDAAFSLAFEEALRLGYLGLEAEALREQRDTQRAYAIEPPDDAVRAQSFERTMQLLRHYGRTAGAAPARRAERPGTRWTFEATIEAIEKGLRAFGVEIPDLPSEDNPADSSPGEGEGPADGDA